MVEVRLLVEPRLQVDGAPDRLARRREDGERLVARTSTTLPPCNSTFSVTISTNLVVRPAADSAPNSSVYRE